MSLYIVATPIGNTEEITPRALRLLSEADVIAAEDTRNTGLLLSRLGISAGKLVAYHKFNENARLGYLLEKLQGGESVALVSDAGTPCISDPGYLLVRAAADAGVPVVGVSGACAVAVALSVSGFPAEPFVYIGFLPRKAAAAAEALAPLDGEITLVFYESPKRIVASLQLIAEIFPCCLLCLCNDLTKKFERTYRGTPSQVLAEIQANPHAEKGEYTCVAYSAAASPKDAGGSPTLESLLIDIIVKSGCSLKEAIAALSSQLADTPKKEIYAASLRLKEMKL